MGIDLSKAIEQAARQIAAEAKRVTPISTVTPAEMAEHLRSCTCHTHLNDLDEGGAA